MLDKKVSTISIYLDKCFQRLWIWTRYHFILSFTTSPVWRNPFIALCTVKRQVVSDHGTEKVWPSVMTFLWASGLWTGSIKSSVYTLSLNKRDTSIETQRGKFISSVWWSAARKNLTLKTQTFVVMWATSGVLTHSYNCDSQNAGDVAISTGTNTFLCIPSIVNKKRGLAVKMRK